MTERREESLFARCQALVRDTLLAFFGNEGLFLLMAFISAAVLGNDALGWYREQTGAVYSFIVVPWGAALCLRRLQLRAGSVRQTGADVTALFVLYVWLVVPFAIRFGATFNNMSAWYGYGVMYFGVYASVSEQRGEGRARKMALTAGLFALLAVIWSGVLLYCAATGTQYGVDFGRTVFGVSEGYLYAGLHYNTTAMIALSLCGMCWVASACTPIKAVRWLYVIPAVMNMAVIVLTQSRTSRYALLLALAFGAFDIVRRALKKRAGWMSVLAALACAAVVLVGGFEVCSRATVAALTYYEQLAEDGQAVSLIPAAAAEEEPAETPQPEAGQAAEAPQPEAGQAAEAPQPEAGQATEEPQPEVTTRAAVDSTFSDRTNIWKNVFKLWKDEPKLMLIGNGVGNTGRKIVEGTIHEENGAVTVHNSYLQWTADFGLIGAALQLVFLVIALRQALRVLLAEKRQSGALALCMCVAAALAVGLMESTTLGDMTPTNLVFMYALAQLSAMNREMEASNV